MLLTDFPDQRELLLADFDGRIGDRGGGDSSATASPVIFMRRTVTRDHRMNGHDFHEGDKAVLYYWSANQDETVFADPARLDITRSPNPHVGFGAAGPHFCLGAHLARREVGVMLRELLTRVPDIRAAGPPDRLLSSFINGDQAPARGGDRSAAAPGRAAPTLAQPRRRPSPPPGRAVSPGRRSPGPAAAHAQQHARSGLRARVACLWAPVQRVEVPGQGHVGGGQAAGGVG